MTGWLKLTNEQRKATIAQAEQMSGINAKAIEKDWWVTLTLKALFQSPYAQYIVFKGGTSLSKCWKLITRFSEDIDIALAPEAFGMKYVESPSKTAVEKIKAVRVFLYNGGIKSCLGEADCLLTCALRYGYDKCSSCFRKIPGYRPTNSFYKVSFLV